MSELSQEPNQTGQKKPQNYLVWAILTTALCCLPFGIASIVYASRVNADWNAGNYQSATDNSNKAKKWAIWSAIAAAIVYVLYFILVFIGALA